MDGIFTFSNIYYKNVFDMKITTKVSETTKGKIQFLLKANTKIPLQIYDLKENAIFLTNKCFKVHTTKHLNDKIVSVMKKTNKTTTTHMSVQGRLKGV